MGVMEVKSSNRPSINKTLPQLLHMRLLAVASCTYAFSTPYGLSRSPHCPFLSRANTVCTWCIIADHQARPPRPILTDSESSRVQSSMRHFGSGGPQSGIGRFVVRLELSIFVIAPAARQRKAPFPLLDIEQVTWWERPWGGWKA